MPLRYSSLYCCFSKMLFVVMYHAAIALPRGSGIGLTYAIGLEFVSFLYHRQSIWSHT